MSEIKLTMQNFETEIADSKLPVLVDFWATWCGPCQMLGPIISEIAVEKADKLKVCKVNVDENPALAAAFAITSIPTLILFEGGKPVKQTMGYMQKAQLLEWLGK